MKFNYIPTGQIKSYAQKLAKTSMFSLEGWLKKTLNSFNVPNVDPCCPADTTTLPVRYNDDINQLEYYINNVWTVISTGPNIDNELKFNFSIQEDPNPLISINPDLIIFENNTTCFTSLPNIIFGNIANNTDYWEYSLRTTGSCNGLLNHYNTHVVATATYKDINNTITPGINYRITPDGITFLVPKTSNKTDLIFVSVEVSFYF